MFALDLFNTDHERRLAEGAVDQLEQRRIDDLAMKMDDLVARAKKADTPEARAALVKEFQKCKAERDSYYKIKDECMGYGTLTGEGQTTPTTTGLHHRGTKGYGADYSDSGVEFAKQKYHGDLNKVDKPLTKSLEKGMDVDFDEAGIPGNIPVEKIPGKEDLLKGRGRSYYENSQKKNSKTVVEYISMGSDKNYIEAEPYKNYKIYVRKKPFGNTGMYTAHTEIDRKEFMGKGSSQEEAIQAIRDRIDFVLNAQKKVTGSSTIDFNVKFATDLLADPKQAFYAKLENINGQPKLIIASPEVAGDPELLAAGDFKRSALRNQVDDEGRATPLPGIPLTAKSLRSGDWIANGRYTIGNETTDRDGNRVFDLTYHSTAHTKSDKLRLNQPAFTLGTTREVDEEGSPIASARRGGQRDNSAQARHTTYYGAMDEGRMGEIDAQRQDLERMTDRQFMAAYGMSKQAFEHRYRTLLKPALDEARLAVGDPIVVTAPNEFEGKTGEIYDFSPSGAFVIVNLYNHGKHSMHLSDVAYNDYADQEEADDWYDDADEFGKPGSEFFSESANPKLDAIIKNIQARVSNKAVNDPATMKRVAQMVQQADPAVPDAMATARQLVQQYGQSPAPIQTDTSGLRKLKPGETHQGINAYNQALGQAPIYKANEGFQDFNKKEPYEVCLAGKCVKTFDYYEDARRFHDNWKKKLYREGDKAKADKITLNPVMKEAANPAQQAAIAIAMKKAGKKPKQVDEAGTRSGALNTAQQLYNAIQSSKGKPQHEIDLLQRQLNALVRKYQLKPEEYTAGANQQSQQQSGGQQQRQQPPPPPPGGQQAGQQNANQSQQGNWWQQQYEKHYGQNAQQQQQANPDNIWNPQWAAKQQAAYRANGGKGLDPNWAQQHMDASAKMMQANQADMNKMMQAQMAAGPWNMPGAKMAAAEEGVAEAGSPAQQAAIAMKKAGKKPKSVDENTVQIPHKGKMVSGKVVRKDPVSGEYIVDVGEYGSVRVPAHKVKHDVEETTAFLTRGPRLSYGTQAQHTTLGPVQVEKNMPDGSVVVHCERDGKKYRTQPSSLKVAVAETVTDIKSEMAKVYRRLAPKIERHRDSFLAGQLYDELENIAELHGAEAEFKRMMAGARNRAHMDYDTNPGGFQNWFWYLPFGDNELAEESTTSTDAVERAILNRIMVANTDLLMKFGPDKVMQAAEEVAYNVGDVDEIGTSDVSAYVNQVRQILGVEA